jgi:hypothetical protein
MGVESGAESRSFTGENTLMSTGTGTKMGDTGTKTQAQTQPKDHCYINRTAKTQNKQYTSYVQ